MNKIVLLILLLTLIWAGCTNSRIPISATPKEYSILNFGAPWCLFCAQLDRAWVSPDIQKLIEDDNFYKINIDEYVRFSKAWKVSAVPTVVLIRHSVDGENIEIARFSGFKRRVKLREWLIKSKLTWPKS